MVGLSAATLENGLARTSEGSTKLIEQARLADTCRAGHEDTATPPIRLRLGVQASQKAQLGASTDEGRGARFSEGAVHGVVESFTQ